MGVLRLITSPELELQRQRNLRLQWPMLAVLLLAMLQLAALLPAAPAHSADSLRPSDAPAQYALVTLAAEAHRPDWVDTDETGPDAAALASWELRCPLAGSVEYISAGALQGWTIHHRAYFACGPPRLPV